jgi:glycosyltransferase involved in cell wall biosynthesis
MKFDLTCVLTGHREGRLAIPSLRSFWIAIEHARAAGYKVQTILCLDRPDALTQSIFESFKKQTDELIICDYGDQGKVRNEAVDKAKGKYTAFLDGDDLWSRPWLQQGLEFLAEQGSGVIAHPEFNYFFEKQGSYYCQIDQEAPEFRMDLLRIANYWDALSICETKCHVDHPFCERDIEAGWAYEDWFWNCETLAAEYKHKIVPNTVLFKRRQKTSQTIKAWTNKSLIRYNPLSSYDNPIYWESKTGGDAGK